MPMGLKLKIKRMEKGVSQVELGKVIKVSRQTISLYERGKQIPRPEKMKILAEYLGISVQELFFE